MYFHMDFYLILGKMNIFLFALAICFIFTYNEIK